MPAVAGWAPGGTWGQATDPMNAELEAPRSVSEASIIHMSEYACGAACPRVRYVLLCLGIIDDILQYGST